MKTDELREAFLDFFVSKGCVRRPSDVLVPNDPTVLFTPAGMNQFKREFMGLGDPTFTRATTCQKCLRTGDIENVGKTAFQDRKSTRLNSSHEWISYAVFCLKKKNKQKTNSYTRKPR